MPEFSARLAIERPDENALVDRDRCLGWAEVDSTLNRVASRILGTDLGDQHRVAVFAENSAETALAHLGSLLGGASTVPVNFHLTAPEAAYIIEDSGTRVLFVGPETAETGLAAAHEAGVDTVVAWTAGDDLAVLPDGVTPWDEWLAGGDDVNPPLTVKPRPNLLYTSGTTGRPKGTELPPTMFAGGDTMAEHLDALREARFVDYGPHLVVGPMYHTGPLSGMRILVAGTPSVILGRFDAEATLAAIEKHRTRSAVMVPTHFVRLLALPEEVRDRYDVSSMEYVAHTGAKCPDEVKRAMIDWWGPVFLEAYGASEVGTTCSINSEDWLRHPGSVGQADPPFEAVIIGDDDKPVPPGVEGRLYFRDATGRGVVYHNDPEKSAAAHLEPGVFTLGEMARMDDDGFVYITDRFSDMVVSGGVNLYPAEVENFLIDHPAVHDVACIGIPHPEMGEQLRALVVLEPGESATEDGIIDYCRERLSSFKCPRSVEFVDDLGRTTMGKISRRALRAPYWD
ncbi:MAG: AMP-binding protein [Actinomycetia bacterium]|nr:AMP-binding protein [Actinomycetes bacterium]